MKRSELKTIIKEELINEGLIERFFNFLQNAIEQDRKRRIEREADAELAERIGRFRDAHDDLERFVRNEMSKEEIIELEKKLRGL